MTDGETALIVEYLVAGNLPRPTVEYKFNARRKWRFDLAWPAFMVAVEIEGGVWSRGRHVRPMGYLSDMEKYNAAALGCWLVLRYTPQQIVTDIAVGEIARAIEMRA